MSKKIKFKDKHKPYTSPTLNKSPIIEEARIERRINNMLKAQDKRLRQLANKKARFLK